MKSNLTKTAKVIFILAVAAVTINCSNKSWVAGTSNEKISAQSAASFKVESGDQSLTVSSGADGQAQAALIAPNCRREVILPFDVVGAVKEIEIQGLHADRDTEMTRLLDQAGLEQNTMNSRDRHWRIYRLLRLLLTELRRRPCVTDIVGPIVYDRIASGMMLAESVKQYNQHLELISSSGASAVEVKLQDYRCGGLLQTKISADKIRALSQLLNKPRLGQASNIMALDADSESLTLKGQVYQFNDYNGGVILLDAGQIRAQIQSIIEDIVSSQCILPVAIK
jgi:hypothetical protein